MKQSYEVLKEAVDKVGIKVVAHKLNLSVALMYKWCQEYESQSEGSGSRNPLDRIREIYELTKDDELVHWFCQLADGYFVKNATIEKKYLDVQVLNNIQKIIKEFSEILEVVSKSYNDDKKISIKEAISIRKEWEDLKQIGECFVRACEEGKFSKGK